MQICAIHIQAQKKEPLQAVESINCVVGKGIEGDCHADGSERQISFLPKSAAEQIEEMKQGRPCLEKIKVNLVISDAEQAVQGSLLQFQQAALRVTKKGRPCHGLCDLAQNGHACPLVENLYFAEVANSGILSLGETGELL